MHRETLAGRIGCGFIATRLARARAKRDAHPGIQRPNATMNTYYDPADLPKFGSMGEHAPALAKKFFDYYGAVFADGALSAREKSLIALGVALAVQCPYCIDAYTQDSLAKGCDAEQLTEVAHVATAIKGGSALAHGLQMKNAAAKVAM
jgi:alkylhydroperoxidase/carboxymuconolactone decarboxylase family protein